LKTTKTFLFSISSTNFMLLFIHNLTEQNEIQSEMDEVADDGSNFISNRTEKADTQTRRLISQTLLHETNTGDSSRFSSQ
jgi:hypothetical protein